VTNFYVLPEDVTGDQVLFRAAEAKHLCAVCRQSVGDIVNAVDGLGNEYRIMLEQVSTQSAIGRVLRRRRRSREPVSRVILAQAITKGAKMDLVVQKATELGAHGIIPMITEHTVVAPDELSSSRKQQRWQKVAVSAMKQSLRSYLPVVDEITGFRQVLQRAHKCDLALMASVVKDAVSLERISDLGKSSRDILLLVGPEGGFSAEEITLALQGGIELVSLGPRRLRSETAGVLLLGLVLFHIGELG